MTPKSLPNVCSASQLSPFCTVWSSSPSTMADHRAPQDAEVDLHLLSHWSAQLLVIDYLREVRRRLLAGWQFPTGHASFVTGHNTKYLSRAGPLASNNLAAPVRSAVRSLLQVCATCCAGGIHRVCYHGPKTYIAYSLAKSDRRYL